MIYVHLRFIYSHLSVQTDPIGKFVKYQKIKNRSPLFQAKDKNMDFISSISFPNEPLISWTFLQHFCHHFWMGATAKQKQTHPKVKTEMFNWSEVRSFGKEILHTYKIHILVFGLKQQTVIFDFFLYLLAQNVHSEKKYY